MGYAKSVYAKAAEILKERKSAAIEAANIKKNTESLSLVTKIIVKIDSLASITSKV